jgi:hypothetical protein
MGIRHEKLMKLFGEVLAWLESPASGSPAPWRAELERQLSLAIADFECLGIYQYALKQFQRTLNRLDRIPAVWCHDVPLETVFLDGWGCVDDSKLGALGLNLYEIELLYSKFSHAKQAGRTNHKWNHIVGTMTREEALEDPEEKVLYGYREGMRKEIDKALADEPDPEIEQVE